MTYICMRRLRFHTKPVEKRNYFTKSSAGWIVFGFLVALQIFFAIQISTFGAELSVLEDKSTTTMKHNQELRTAVITKQSLMSAEDKSNALGFVKPQKVVFVKQGETVTALR